jgi:D-serine deaminase-like pyridoxal phosphate-dependent protein
MARYFAAAGWTDLTVAFPVNIREIGTINELAGSIRLQLVVEAVEVISFLAENVTAPVELMIKVDIGYGRTGVAANDLEQLDALINAIESSASLSFRGFLGHAGHSYGARSQAEIAAVHHDSLRRMQGLCDHYQPRFPELLISIGDTPTCSTMTGFGCAHEIRPGNFVFYDLTQHRIGSCSLDEIAVAIACPVVARHPEREELVVYGGGVHFSKDVLEHPDYGRCYGLLVEPAGDSWGAPVPGVYLQRLSQEHGIVRAPRSFIEQCRIGELLYFLPVHSCMAANLHDRFWTTTEDLVMK